MKAETINIHETSTQAYTFLEGRRYAIVHNYSYKRRVLTCILVFLILLFSSRASVIAKSDLALIVSMICSIFLNIFQKNTKHYILNICKISSLFIFILFVYFLKNNALDMYTWIGFYAKILFAFSVVNYTKELFLPMFIKIVYYLCLISLPLFLLQIISFETLFSLNNFAGVPSTRGLDPNSNSIIYNIQNIHKFRNSGFMWEPGAFSAVIVLALILSFKLKNQFDMHKFTFIITILSTLSTTGYIATFIVFAYFSYRKLNFISFLLIIPLSILLLNTNFITKKIQDQVNDIEDELILTQFSDEYNIHLNRFASFYVDLNTFSENPFIGMGMDIYSTGKNTFYKDYDENVVRTSGLMLGLVKLGVIGMGFYLFVVYRQFKKRHHDNKFAILFCLIILLLLFSNPLEFSTIFLCFLFI